MTKGRLNVLGDAALEHPTTLAWDRDSSAPESSLETPNTSRCCQGMCSWLWAHWGPQDGY